MKNFEEIRNMTIIKYLKKLINRKRFKNLLLFFIVVFSFAVLDSGFRMIYQSKVPFINWYSFSPSSFMLCFIIIVTTIIYFLPKKISKFTYLVTYLLFIIFVVAESIHMETLGRFFGYGDLIGTKEGAEYFKSVLGKINFKVLILVIICLILMIISFKLLGNIDRLKLRFKQKLLFITLALFISISLYTFASIKLGSKPSSDWDKSVSYYDAYHTYKDNNRSVYISGIYFYLFRNPYIYIKSNISMNKQEVIKEIDKYFEINKKDKEINEYTNYFKDKNLIYIMMESVDTFLINDEYMPTLNTLKNTGLNFTNYYAPMFGSGYTFNTEFALNTGIYSPIDGGAYTLNNNNYMFSLPNLFEKSNYTTSSVHQNYGAYYNRAQMHLAFGYNNHYDRSYMKKDLLYHDDENLIKDETIYNYIAKSSNKFMTFITTFSLHFPYTKDNDICKISEEFKEGLKTNNEEISCIKVLSKRTDNFIKALIEKLKTDNLLDNTVLILTADHYMYGMSDTTTLYKLKNNKDYNLLSNVPLIIWSNGLTHKEISNLSSTNDLVPTIANLFGLEYNPTYYLGNDIFSPNHPSYVYFSNNSWIDTNNIYKMAGSLTNEDNAIYNEVRNKLELNDLILKTNYFNHINNNNDI